jgi:uroporphyrinogen decarboxylase
MTLEQDRIKSLTYTYPDYIPVSVGILPAAWIKYRKSLDELVCSHPVIFGECKVGERDYDAVHTGTYRMGTHIDAWGCVWSNLTTGMESIVTQHPVPTRADVRVLKMPVEDSGFPHGFMYLRLLDLRGFEEVMLDFAEEPPELQMLIDIVLAYNLRQAKILLAGLESSGQKGSIVVFGDDLGMQQRLAISPQKWRQYLKPCFTQIYQPFREVGYYIYMHTDGHILEIIPDLVDAGVNVVNPQIGANGLDNLVEVCKGKVCVDLDLDRQKFPFFSPQDIDDHIHKAVDKLGSPAGGLWLKAEIGQDVPLENIAAIFDALEKYRSYYA